jgi:DUF1365 family protein
VNNTFGESHNYWLSSANRVAGKADHIYRCPKLMHVSPFMPMELEYRFTLPTPGQRLVAHMNTLRGGAEAPVRGGPPGPPAGFDATLTLNAEPWSAQALRRALIRFPLVTLKVIAAIHWEALRLWAKRVPVFTHPARLQQK